MRAVQITAYGGPENVRLNEVEAPVPGAGAVLVRVAAAGVNPVDWKIREGYMKDFMPFDLPVTMGNEVAGTVVTVGPGVTDFAPGDEVYGSIGPVGAFADMVAPPASSLARKPANLSMIDAAALPVAVVTAQAAFDGGGVTAGTRMLIHAAAGGVGSVAVQMAHALGAHVTALTSPETMDFVRDLGADHVVDRTTAYENSIGDFDVVLDAFGPPAQERSWGLLKKGGIMISLVAPPDEATAASHGVRGTMVFGAANAVALKAAAALAEAGKLKPKIQRTYPVEQALDALAEVERGQVRGKIVLTF